MVRRSATAQDVEELYRRHSGEVRGFLYRRAGQDGADLLGEVFVVALKRRAELPEPELRRAWLFGTARRLLLANARVERRRLSAQDAHLRLQATFAGAEVEREDAVLAVREAVSTLTEKDQELIRLTEWEQLEIREAAIVLGLRPGTARVRLHRARRALAHHPALLRLLETAVDADEEQNLEGASANAEGPRPRHRPAP